MSSVHHRPEPMLLRALPSFLVGFRSAAAQRGFCPLCLPREELGGGGGRTHFNLHCFSCLHVENLALYSNEPSSLSIKILKTGSICREMRACAFGFPLRGALIMQLDVTRSAAPMHRSSWRGVILKKLPQMVFFAVDVQTVVASHLRHVRTILCKEI